MVGTFGGELMTEIICAAISAAALVITAVIGRNNKIREEKAEKRAALRERESRLSMDMMAANCELCDVISLAVTGGHTNGNVEAAQKKVRAAKEAYEQFLRDTAAYAVSK